MQEINVIGDPDKPQVITTPHLKRVIMQAHDLVRHGHEIVDVKFLIPPEHATTIVLVYRVSENLIVEYEGIDNGTDKAARAD